MENFDLDCWKNLKVLALHGGFYYPATVIGTNNVTSTVFVEFTRSHFVGQYNDVFTSKSLYIICDIIPSYENIMINDKVAVYEKKYDCFSPGFVSNKVCHTQQLLVKIFNGEDRIVPVEDVRLILPIWNPYSINYPQHNISYTNSNVNVYQPHLPALPNQYFQDETFQQLQETLPPLPVSLETPRHFPSLSANNFSGCQIVEKENFKTEQPECCNVNNLQNNFGDLNMQYSSALEAERVNQWNNFNAFYEKNLSYNYFDTKQEELRRDKMVAPQLEYYNQSKDQSYVNMIPTTVKNAPVATTNASSCAPRLKRKYTKRKKLPVLLPEKSPYVPLEQSNLIKTRKPNAYNTFCKEYRNSITSSAFDQSDRHAQKLAAIWNQLPPEQKKIYQDKTKKFEKNHLFQNDWEKLNQCTKNYNDTELFSSTVSSSYMPGPQYQENVRKENGNSYSDDEPQLVIDESKFDEDSEDNGSPLFLPKVLPSPSKKFSPCGTKSQDSLSDHLNTFLKEEDIQREEIKAMTMKAECDTTTNFELENYYDSSSLTKAKTLTGERFFPMDFTIEKLQSETDSDISRLTEKITKELFNYETQHHNFYIERKYDLIIRLFKDHGYYPSGHDIDEFLHKNSDLFVDSQSFKSKILEVRQRLNSGKESSFLPLSPQLRESLISVMNVSIPFPITGYD